ncbi:LysR family transcriptional regulator [Tautonia plasticadhaerens]|uniref:HTH-type transcriptional regulator CysL n=1 Tax=Tautonia plasticadhaerens TaxID=2527974 RepID=A0A518H0W0_9BACT|nr:LysR family transcriptional regulator [Tautonia plasticadhaerens]QDV34477.1 HTH-type transcriptional regulator CysL [Tautonia plasticadhaerens]
MQFEALKIFCDVVRLASFSRGATENGVSQSTASQAVHNLEDRLGAKLIDRSKRPLKPTPHGKVYYEGCLELVERYQEVERRVRALGREDRIEGVVRVAAIYSVGLGHLTGHIAAFRARHPLADCRLECMHPSEVVERVRDGEADLGIVSFPKKWPGLDVVPWRDEEMVLAVPPGHPLADPAGVAAGRLDGARFVHYDRELPIRRAIDRHLKRRGVQVEPGLEFDSIENIKRAVEVGAGAAILPRATLDREVASGSLVAVPLADHPLVRPLAIIHRGEATLGLAGARFLRALRDEDEAGERPGLPDPAASPPVNGAARHENGRVPRDGRAPVSKKS